MPDLPWFPCYAKDWLTSQKVSIMTIAQEGAYHRLLCFAWTADACALRMHEPELKRLAKWSETDGDFAFVLSCFEPSPVRPGCIHNPRLTAEREKAIKIQRDTTERAQKAAQIRWTGKPVKPIARKHGSGLSRIADIADKVFPPIP